MDEPVQIYCANYQGLANKMFEDSDFCDVTLVSADNQHVPAHKAVLSSSSSFLRGILFESLQQNTFLYMGMISFEVLKALVRYIYLGHCSIEKNKERDLYALAKQLEIDFPPEPSFPIFKSTEPETNDIIEPYYFQPTQQATIDTAAIKVELQGEESTASKQIISDSQESDIKGSEISEKENNDKEIPNTEIKQMLAIQVSQSQEDLEEELLKKKPAQSDIANVASIDPLICLAELAAPIITSDLDTKDSILHVNTSPEVDQTESVESSQVIKEDDICRKVEYPKIRKIEPSSDSKYHCDECETGPFMRWESLKRHKLSLHEGFMFDCNLCDRQFTRRDDLTKHQQFIHKGISFDCEICGHSFQDKTHLLIHKSEIKCDVCDKVLCNQLVLQKHKRDAHDPQYRDGAYSCTKCRYESKKKFHLKLHIQSVHEGQGPRHFCNLCPYESHDKFEIKEHKQVEHDGINFKCEKCEYESNKSVNLRNHIKREHEGITHDCPECKYKGKSKDFLKKHISGVHNKTKIKCKICDHEVFYYSSLLRHVRQEHEGVRYKCSIIKCDFSTKFKETLKTHEDRHKRDPDYKHTGRIGFKKAKYSKVIANCPHCEKSFKLNRSLKRHLRKKHDIYEKPIQKKVKCQRQNCCVNAFDKEQNTETKKDILKENIEQIKSEEPSRANKMKQEWENNKLVNDEILTMIESANMASEGYCCKVCGEKHKQWNKIKSHIYTFHITERSFIQVDETTKPSKPAKVKTQLKTEVKNYAIQPVAEGLEEVEAAIECHLARAEEGGWKCVSCDYRSMKKMNVKGHVEAKHIVSAGFQCVNCPKICSTRKALVMHRSRSYLCK